MLQLMTTTFGATAESRLNGGYRTPVCFQSQEAIIFPPVSDHDDSPNQLESLSTTLNASVAYIQPQLAKKFIFPLVQEQSLIGYRRNHWVTLHYDPSTAVATVIDSRPWYASYWYSTSPIKNSLALGLSRLGLRIEQFKVVYQGVQDDWIRCGAWTATNIELLATGKSVEDLLRELTRNQRDAVVAHQQHKIDHQQNRGLYQPEIYDTDRSSSDFDSNDDDLDDCTYPDEPIIAGGSSVVAEPAIPVDDRSSDLTELISQLQKHRESWTSKPIREPDPFLTKIQAAMHLMHAQIDEACTDFIVSKNPEDLYNKIQPAFQVTEIAFRASSNLSYAEWFLEHLCNLYEFFVQLVHRYVLGNPDAPIEYRDTLVQRQRALHVCNKNLQDTKITANFFFEKSGVNWHSTHDNQFKDYFGPLL